MNSSSVIFLLIAIVIVGIFVFVAMMLSGRRHAHAFDKEQYQTNWLAIENSLRSDSPATYNMAIMEADKLLDEAMRELRTPGKTMGERLKYNNSKFTHTNAVWAAHKLRNQIAHEHGFKVEYRQARYALASFRGALKDLGAI